MSEIKQPTKRQLEPLLEAFEEIEAGFSMCGFGQSYSANAVGGDTEDQGLEEDLNEEEDDSFDDDFDEAGYDREDIEVAIDAFLSSLSKAGVIRKNKKGRLPSFSQVFDQLFGENHPLVSLAAKFEGFIEGYFGYISYEDFSQAYEQFCQIQSGIQEALTKC